MCCTYSYVMYTYILSIHCKICTVSSFFGKIMLNWIAWFKFLILFGRWENPWKKAGIVASKKYMEAAMNSATVSMKSAWKGISSQKVHPSWRIMYLFIIWIKGYLCNCLQSHEICTLIVIYSFFQLCFFVDGSVKEN